MPLRSLPKWLRLWLRISVRGLILLVLIVGAGLGWIVQGDTNPCARRWRRFEGTAAASRTTGI